ncbi:MAG: hypothetical protein HRT94_09315 [Alphaproteobacteria bacterium]|nr:hypothetical protein [Alphaproteobacteria bacterium]
MFGLEIAAVGLLHLAVSDHSQQIQCKPKVSPKINILPTKSSVKYDYSKSKNDLERFDIDTVSPYGSEHRTHVGGLMSGQIQLAQQTEFMQEMYDHVGYGCVYIKKIDVKIHIDPTIYIASEYKQGSCKHRQIKKHEKKHVREDQLVVNKYADLVGKDLKAILNAGGYSFGPYKISELLPVQKRLQDKLEQAVKARHAEMQEERQKRQQAIDSKEEYESIAAACLESR